MSNRFCGLRRFMAASRAVATLVILSSLGILGGCAVAPSDLDELGLKEDDGLLSSGLTKGSPGAAVGQGNYCDDPANPCAAGEGDCDQSSQCVAGLVCGRGKLLQFGFAGGGACVPEHCTNKRRDADETQIDCGGGCGSVCAAPVCPSNGASNRCSTDCLCAAGEGDCDSNDQCLSGLICARNKLMQFGFPSGDSCVPEHCVNKRRDADETQIDCGGGCGPVCVTPSCQPNRCTTDCPCGPGEGDCDSNAECEAGLVCGYRMLRQFGFSSGSACVPAHCTNDVTDGNETSFDCGGDCGSIGCPTKGCADSGATFDITIRGTWVESFLRPPNYEWGDCTYENGSYQRVIRATVVNGSVIVEDPSVGFNGTYAILDETFDGFRAEASSLSTPGYVCGNSFGGGEPYAYVSMTFACATGKATFTADCDNNSFSNGCSPDYEERAQGTGLRVYPCAPGFMSMGGVCVDIDECLGNPCHDAETCTNTPGTYSCSCDAPAGVCNSRCVDLTSDVANCGACGITCASTESCVAGTCMDIDECATVFPCGMNATCVDRPLGFDCTCNPGFVEDAAGDCVLIPEPTVDDFVSVSAGAGSVCGIDTSGAPRCWGNNAYGAALPPPTAALAAIEAGRTQSCGIAENGALVCWGAPGRLTDPPPAGAFQKVSVSIAQDYACALRVDGTVACWGANDDGQASSPVGTFVDVAAGATHTCGVRTDGTIACWGYEDASIHPPAGTFSAVASGRSHSCGLRTDGSIACWGWEASGTLNPPSGVYSAITTGPDYACALDPQGAATCWGSDYLGQILPPPFTFQAIDAGDGVSCGLTSQSKIVCWGRCSEGVCSPPIGALRDIVARGTVCEHRQDDTLRCWDGSLPGAFKKVARSTRHVCAIRLDDTLVCWGANEDHQSDAPSGAFVDVAAGEDHTCGIRTDGTVTCWGLADQGRLAAPSGTFQALAASNESTCGLRSDGTMECWGWIAPLPGLPGTFKAIAAGAFQVCAIRMDDGIDCWFDFEGMQPPTGAFRAVSAGAQHACAIRMDQTLACWGVNTRGESTPPSGTFLAVVADYGYTCGIRTDGTEVCWGERAR